MNLNKFCDVRKYRIDERYARVRVICGVRARVQSVLNGQRRTEKVEYVQLPAIFARVVNANRSGEGIGRSIDRGRV
jgi:hypothetical protein